MAATPASDLGAPAEPVRLFAQVAADGGQFVATVAGLELAGSGNTPASAQEALVQAMRGWLERLDTAGKLGEALGVAEPGRTDRDPPAVRQRRGR